MLLNTNRLRILAGKAGLLGLMRWLYLKKYFHDMNKRYNDYQKTGKIPIPERFVFDLTFKCNLHCKMCYINFPSMWKKRTLDGRMELNAQQIRQIFEKIPRITQVRLIGGEIFARQDIFDILDYFKERGTLVYLSTNLTMLNDEKIERLKKYKNIEAIGTSIDGDKEVHNDIRDPQQRKAFDQTIETIRKLKDHFYVSITTVVLDENLEELPKLVDITKRSGAHHVAFEFERRYTPETIQRSADYLGFNPEDFPLALTNSELPHRALGDFKASLDAVENKAKDANVDYSYMPILFKDKLEKYLARSLDTEHFCKQLFIGRIDAQGNVVHCFAIRKPFGNLLTQSYEEIWNSEEYQQFRKRMEGVILPICETCEKLIECKGGKPIKPFAR